MRDQGTLAAVVTITVLSIAAAALLAQIQDACTGGMIKSALHPGAKDAAPTAASCFEFWANRYQTLFTGLAAIGAAALTWLGTQRQIAATLASNDLIRRQTAATSLERLSERLRTLTSIRDQMSELENLVRRVDGGVLIRKIDKAIAEINKTGVFNQFNSFHRKTMLHLSENSDKIVASQNIDLSDVFVMQTTVQDVSRIIERSEEALEFNYELLATLGPLNADIYADDRGAASVSVFKEVAMRQAAFIGQLDPEDVVAIIDAEIANIRAVADEALRAIENRVS